MSRMFAVLMLTVFLVGCNGERRRVSRETNSMTSKYAKLSKDGKTTPEEDKQYIQSVSKVMHELDRSIRGKKKADATRRNAEIEADTGIKPEGPLRLDQ